MCVRVGEGAGPRVRVCVLLGRGGRERGRKRGAHPTPPCLKYHSRFSVDPPLSSCDPSPLRHHSHPHTRAMSSAALRLPPTPRLAAVRRCRRACVAPVAAAPGPGKDMATDLRARGRDFMAVRSVFLVFFFFFWGGGGILGPCVAGGCKEHASAMAGAMAAAAGEAELIGREKKKKETAPGAWTCRPRRRRRPDFRSRARPGTVLPDIDHVHQWCRRAGRGGLPACRWGVVLPPTHPPRPPQLKKRAAH